MPKKSPFSFMKKIFVLIVSGRTADCICLGIHFNLWKLFSLYSLPQSIFCIFCAFGHFQLGVQVVWDIVCCRVFSSKTSHQLVQSQLFSTENNKAGNSHSCTETSDNCWLTINLRQTEENGNTSWTRCTGWPAVKNHQTSFTRHGLNQVQRS